MGHIIVFRQGQDGKWDEGITCPNILDDETNLSIKTFLGTDF